MLTQQDIERLKLHATNYKEQAHCKDILALIDHIDYICKTSHCAWCGAPSPRYSDEMRDHMLTCEKSPLGHVLDMLFNFEDALRDAKKLAEFYGNPELYKDFWAQCDPIYDDRGRRANEWLGRYKDLSNHKETRDDKT